MVLMDRTWLGHQSQFVLNLFISAVLNFFFAVLIPKQLNTKIPLIP
jgi:hypothetical protein